MVVRRWYADVTYCFIIDKVNEFFYIVTWYKERGRTSCILFQGDPITADEMDFLLKNLVREKRRAEIHV